MAHGQPQQGWNFPPLPPEQSTWVSPSQGQLSLLFIRNRDWHCVTKKYKTPFLLQKHLMVRCGITAASLQGLPGAAPWQKGRTKPRQEGWGGWN